MSALILMQVYEGVAPNVSTVARILASIVTFDIDNITHPADFSAFNDWPASDLWI